MAGGGRRDKGSGEDTGAGAHGGPHAGHANVGAGGGQDVRIEIVVANYLGIGKVLRVTRVGDNWPVATSCLGGGLSLLLTLVSITSML